MGFLPPTHHPRPAPMCTPTHPKGEFRSAQYKATVMSQNPLPLNDPAVPAPTGAASPGGRLGEVARLQEAIALFARERDWDQFHSPKNLASALSVEAAELLEHFQWLTEAESQQLPPHTLEEVGAELADVLLYLIRISDKLGIDLIAAANAKIVLNAEKYPVEKARGSSRKYTEL